MNLNRALYNRNAIIFAHDPIEKRLYVRFSSLGSKDVYNLPFEIAFFSGFEKLCYIEMSNIDDKDAYMSLAVFFRKHSGAIFYEPTPETLKLFPNISGYIMKICFNEDDQY